MTAREILLQRRDEILRVKRDFSIHQTSDELERVEAMVAVDVEVQLAEGDRERLKQIESALKRIDFGTYGECLVCEDEISPARLKALPWTATCLRCAEKEERKRVASAARISLE
jgi:DnaK suppressor protein